MMISKNNKKYRFFNKISLTSFICSWVILFICIGMNIFTFIVYNDPIKWLPTVDNDNIALKVGLVKGFIVSIISIISSIIIQELTANIFWSEIYEKGLMINIANMLFADKFNIKSFLVPWWK